MGEGNFLLCLFEMRVNWKNEKEIAKIIHAYRSYLKENNYKLVEVFEEFIQEQAIIEVSSHCITTPCSNTFSDRTSMMVKMTLKQLSFPLKVLDLPLKMMRTMMTYQ